jgi:ABC-type transport system substrate-binding protein
MRLPITCCLLWFQLLVTSSPVAGQSSARLYDEEPFDRVVLTPTAGGESFDVFPLGSEQRQAVIERPAGQPLRVRLLLFPEKEFDIAGNDIQRVDYFEDLILDQAVDRVKTGQFNDAYHYFEFLKRNYPGTSGLDVAVEDFLFKDAADQYKSKKLDSAYALLTEVYRLNSKRRGLRQAFSRIAGEIFDRYLVDGNYDAARRFLSDSAKQFGAANIEQALERREKELITKATELLRLARQQFDQGNLRDAYLNSRRVLSIWPKLAGAADFSKAVAQRYPLVSVAVSQPATEFDPRRFGDWAARRTGRLLHRMLMEFGSYGADGGNYDSPWVNIQTSDDRREITVTLDAGNTGRDQPAINGYDVADLMLRMADPQDEAFSSLWSDAFSEVELVEVFQLRFRMDHPVLRPENLFQIPFVEAADGPNRFPTHPYRLDVREGAESRFLRDANYLGTSPSQPVEIVETYFVDGSQARLAFKRADVDIIDRVFPADIEDLTSMADVKIEEYASPSLHMLVPNFDRPFSGHRTFRRAIVFGISRSVILQRDLLGGNPLEGCRVISGPIPVGRSNEDPIGYGYDADIAARPYEPSLALTLFEVSKSELRAKAKRTGGEAPEFSKLRIFHPPADIPRTACSAIAQQLSTIGISAEAVEMRAGQTHPDVADWDFYYVDAVMDEPQFDMRRLLGSAGLVRGGSAYLELALRQLSTVTNWTQSRERMHEIHRLAHQELVVIPLWQLIDRLAYRDQIQGIPRRPISLYQNVEQWTIAN